MRTGVVFVVVVGVGDVSDSSRKKAGRVVLFPVCASVDMRYLAFFGCCHRDRTSLTFVI
jgi:hypothetical protein